MLRNQFVAVVLLIGARISAHSVHSPQDASKATGNKKVLVVRVDFPDSTSSTSDWLDDTTAAEWLGGSTDPESQVNAHLQKSSFGRLALQLTIMPGVVRMPAAISSYSNAPGLYDGLKSVSNLDYDPASYDSVMFFWENSAGHFGFAGQGFSGTPMVMAINGVTAGSDGKACTFCHHGLIIHEMAHCLGANYHADSWLASPIAPPSLSADGAPMCSANSQNDPVSSCSVYSGDAYDPLSWPSQTTGSQVQASIKWQFGWIQASEVHVANDTFGFGERVRIVAHDFGTKSLPSDGSSKLALAAASATAADTWLWVEYKAAYKNEFSQETYSSTQQQELRRRGALLHLASGPGSSFMSTPLLLDAFPSTTQETAGDWPKGLADAPLQLGRSLEITGHDLVVTVLSKSCNEDPPWLEVMVQRSTSGNAAPTVSGIRQSQSNVCAGVAVDLTCDATDTETSQELLAFEWDMGDGEALWNSESLRTRRWTWNEAGTFKVSCTAADGGGKQATASADIVVGGPTVSKQDISSSDGANQCNRHLCAFISDSNTYDYPILWVNGPSYKDGWFGNMEWMTGFEATAFAFDGLTIPAATDVELAELVLTPADGSPQVDIGTVSIKVELSTAAQGLTTGLDSNWACDSCLTEKRSWTAAVNWTIPDVAGGEAVSTANFGHLVTELVRLPGWSGSGRLVVSLTPAGGSGVLAVLKSAQLKVRWQTRPAGDTCPPLSLASVGSSGNACSQPSPTGPSPSPSPNPAPSQTSPSPSAGVSPSPSPSPSVSNPGTTSSSISCGGSFVWQVVLTLVLASFASPWC
eukprot:TRINITY_DN92821_c0_g1_i1.p1 TRINITY_DN92821_c0_g1~~TRINITY_DN92821_c0_g1_i1.p1  ORF type:complete len:808 (-),score=114.85 TRINITY_DN92821_c0_g1_i1:122-2545(-)